VSSGHVELLNLRLPCDRAAPARARHALEEVREVAPIRDDALLVASELTTNAVLHSGADPDAEIEVRAELLPDGVVIEVIDEGRSATVPHTRPPDPSLPGGWGLPVIAAVARRWGTERRERLRVWAELPL
jgi:anti-sigma regulatory factor (Ser/Thr protein kinase)